MSLKAERGTKRLCPSCGSKFYDLNRDPIVCPICQSVYQVTDSQGRPAASGNNLDADDDAVLDAGRGGIEFVPIDEVVEGDADELPDLEDGDLGDAGDDADAVLDTGTDDEAFLEAEDEGEADVTGFVGGGNDDEI